MIEVLHNYSHIEAQKTDQMLQHNTIIYEYKGVCVSLCIYVSMYVCL